MNQHNQSVLQKAAKGLSILFLVKIFARVVDFVLNIIVLRNVEPSTYGLTMHYMVLTNTTLFYTKMCLKNAYQKRGLKATTKETFISAYNLMIFGIGFTILIGILTGNLWHYWYTDLNESFSKGLICYVVACIIESMCEPLLTKFILNFDYSVGAKSEAVSVFLKTLFLFVFTKLEIFPTLFNFGLAQIFQALVLFLSCMFFGGKQSLIPVKIEKQYYVTPEMKENSKQFTLLSLLKLISQELEKLVMINMKQASITQQSEFLLISNIGSMIPRYIYAPIEEISFNLFAKLSQKSSDEGEQNNQKDSDLKKLIEDKTPSMNQQNQENEFDQSKDVLIKVIKLVNIIGALAAAFGIPYAAAFLEFLYGDKWNYPQCVLAMQTYCVYEWVMGLNGITEAFVQGTIEKKELKIYRIAIVGSTFFYIVSCFYLVDFGSAGLILACILSMVSRILVSLYYIQKKVFSPRNKSIFEFFIQSLPDKLFLFASIISFVLGQYLKTIPQIASSPLRLLIVGGANAGVLVLYIAKKSGREFKQLLQSKQTNS